MARQGARLTRLVFCYDDGTGDDAVVDGLGDGGLEVSEAAHFGDLFCVGMYELA